MNQEPRIKNQDNAIVKSAFLIIFENIGSWLLVLGSSLYSLVLYSKFSTFVS